MMASQTGRGGGGRMRGGLGTGEEAKWTESERDQDTSKQLTPNTGLLTKEERMTEENKTRE